MLNSNNSSPSLVRHEKPHRRGLFGEVIESRMSVEENAWLNTIAGAKAADFAAIQELDHATIAQAALSSANQAATMAEMPVEPAANTAAVAEAAVSAAVETAETTMLADNSETYVPAYIDDLNTGNPLFASFGAEEE